MSHHQLFRALHIAIGDRADDLDRMMSGEVYLHDSAGLRDMHVRRRVVERVNPHLESILTEQRRH